MYYLSQLFLSIKKEQKNRKFPRNIFWPYEIKLDYQNWEQIKSLYNYTYRTQKENELSIFKIDDVFVASPPIYGDEKHVKVSHKMRLFYKRLDNESAIKNIEINSKVVFSQRVLISNINRSPEFNRLFSIHTHPAHLNQDNKVTYSFFSPTDMRSFIASNDVIMGLVTNELWFACKTEEVISKVGENGELMLEKVSRKAFNGEKYLDNIVKNEMRRWGIVFYKAKLGGTLYRVN